MLVVTAADVNDREGDLPPGWELAEALSRDYDVILAAPAAGGASHPDFAVVYYNRRNLALLSRDSDLVLLEAPVVNDYDFYSDTGKLLRADWDTIISGNLSGNALRPLGSGSSGATGPEFRVWVPPDEKRGLSHYLGRLRFHMRTGGPGRVLGRGASLVKSKLGGRRSPR